MVIPHVLLMMSCAVATPNEPSRAFDKKAADAVVAELREGWFDSTMPRHLNKILDRQITYLIDLLLPGMDSTVRLGARVTLARFAGDPDEFGTRLPIEGDAAVRIRALADWTAGLIIAALESRGAGGTPAANSELTKSLVPLIEAHLLIGVAAGTRPERFGTETLRHWLLATRRADALRANFWRRVLGNLVGQTAWDRRAGAAALPNDPDVISARVIDALSTVGDVAAACQRALAR